MNFRFGGILGALIFATAAGAEPLDIFHIEEVGPNSDGTAIYTQSWSGAHLTRPYADVHEVYVKGEGKHGTFHGVLELHCRDAERSRWQTESVNHMGNDRVPLEAIRKMRRLYCK